MASDKALELDAALGSCAVQYRELQGQETEKFLSYFKPCIIPVEGIYSSRQGHSNGDIYQVRLLTCKGDHVVHVKEVRCVCSKMYEFLGLSLLLLILLCFTCFAYFLLYVLVIDNINEFLENVQNHKKLFHFLRLMLMLFSLSLV